MNLYFDPNSTKISKLGWVILFGFIVKLLLAQFVPLSSDEAYYWVWGQRLQLSYFDHPPMVAWLFYIGELTSSVLSLTPRWPFVVLGHLSLILWISILKNNLTQNQLITFTLIASCGLLTGFGSIVGTPDVPVVFFWSLSVLVFQSYLQNPRSSLAAILGASLGLGFCSKYHIVLLVPCFLIFLWQTKQLSKLRLSHWFTVILFGALFSSPVIWWNHQHEYISFMFQLKHGFAESSWSLFDNFHYVFGQFLMASPAIAIAAFVAMKKTQSELLLLKILTILPIIFFFLSSFRGSVEANWTIVAHYSLFALASTQVLKFKKWFRFSNLLWLFLIGAVLFHYIHPYPNMARKVDEPLNFQRALKMAEGFSPLYGGNYQYASYLWYFTKKEHFKLRSMSRFDFFDTLSESKPQEKIFYVIAPSYTGPLPDWVVKEGYSSEKVVESKEHVLIKVSKL